MNEWNQPKIAPERTLYFHLVQNKVKEQWIISTIECSFCILKEPRSLGWEDLHLLTCTFALLARGLLRRLFVAALKSPCPLRPQETNAVTVNYGKHQTLSRHSLIGYAWFQTCMLWRAVVHFIETAFQKLVLGAVCRNCSRVWHLFLYFELVSKQAESTTK
jgi:hypothetical protein